jgi:hypothetical protein
MKRQLSKYVLAAGLLGALSSHASVWQETQTWSPAWEQQYSNWINTSFNEDIFMKGPYKGIATDCADAVYIARIIFAYENKLPFAIKDPTGGSNMITNKMSRYDSIKDPLARARKFMISVGGDVSTKTLAQDTYPVAISRENIRAGTVWSRPRITKDNIFRRIFGGTVKEDPGHAEIVKDVTETGAVFLIGSTVPSAVRTLNVTSSLVFMPVETSTGFRNWIQPQQYGMPVESLPGYSMEQFTTIGSGGGNNTSRSISTWTKDVQSHLAERQESIAEDFYRQMDNICTLVKARIDIIQQAEARRTKLAGACMDAGDYDSYSTPSRDKRIIQTLKQMIDVANPSGLTKSTKVRNMEMYFERCQTIQYAPDKSMSLYEYAQSALAGKVSSDPNDSFEARWGLAESTSKCTKYE